MAHSKIIQDIKSGKFAPVYLLHGEESYYIDVISKAIEKHALAENEKDFNQFIFYGKDSDANSIIATAKEFPMMAERKLVIVREAQDLKKNIDDLISYIANPVSTTVLVINYKNKKVAKNTKYYKNALKSGVVFQSDKVPDYKTAGWIKTYCASKNFQIDDKSTFLLAENLGSDLSKIVNEIDKLTIVLDDGHTITPEAIEENIGISKDYNFFELTNSIIEGKVEKAAKIVRYFEYNPKAGPLTVIISQIFNAFDKILRIHFLKDKSPQNLISQLKVAPFIVKKYVNASKLYNTKKCAQNIEILIEFEKKSKGVEYETMKHRELKEMLYRLMH